MTREPDVDCWLHPDVAVGPSPIAGSGLFASAPIAAGTVVSRVGGRLVSDAQLLELLAAAIDPAVPYVDSIIVDEGVHLVLPPRRDAGFANHSCDPNLWWADEYTLIARHDLAAGVEITDDYATSTADPAYLLRCNCGSMRCRGLITGDDWRIPELQRLYDGHWVPVLQRRIRRTVAGT